MKNPARRAALAGLACAVALIAAATAARAALFITLGNGDRVIARIDPGDEIESFWVTMPRGARLTATAKLIRTKGKEPPRLALRVLDPSEVDVAEGHVTTTRELAKVTNLECPASQQYRIEVTGDGKAGNYDLKVSWKNPGSFPAAGDLTDLEEEIPFDAEAGSRVSVSLRAAEGATAVPTLQDIRTPEGAIVHTFPPNTRRTASNVKLSLGGALLLRVVAPSGEGAFTGTITVASPKATNRVLQAGEKQIPVIQGAEAIGAIVGPKGALVEPYGDPEIAVRFPAGLFARETLVFSGAAAELRPLNDSARPAGPAIFFGPEGLPFPANKRPTITIPFDEDEFPDGLGELQVFTRDAKGRVTRVTGVTIDLDDETVSFKTRHFSAFQVFRVPPSDIRLLPGRMEGHGLFGQSVDGDGSTVVVGAPYASDGKGFGSAFVYVRNGNVWKEQARLEPSGPEPAKAFGYSVSLSGDTIAVGALGGAPTPGAAYVFARKAGKWTQQAKVLPDVSANGDFFGRSVSVDGDTLAVGADTSDEESTDEGIAYVYVRDGTSWPKQQQIVATAGSTGDAFGTSVSVSGNTLAVGAPARIINTGAAYVFERAGTSWTQLQRILASDSSQYARFGASVRLSRDGNLRLVVGARSSSVAASGAGEVYVYSRGATAWAQDVKLFLPNPQAGDALGISVAIEGGTLVAGAFGRNFVVGGSDNLTGSVAVFRLVADVWTFEREIRASQTRSGDQFGSSLCLDGTTLFVGSPQAHPTGAAYNGAAYVFDISQP